MERNRLSAAVEERRARDAPLVSLISTNFHDNGFFFPRSLLKQALESYADRQHYRPDPKGDGHCRAAVAHYYAENHVYVDPEQILVTASTSDAYNLVFSAESVPGDSVLLPAPGYPLFEHIAAFHKLQPRFYHMRFEDRFSPDPEGIAAAMDERTRFLVLISPNNPTGRVYREEEILRAAEVCRDRGITVICDEVFSEYLHGESARTGLGPPRPAQLLPDMRVITFNGVSKLLALPDLKLGWMLVTGPEEGGAATVDGGGGKSGAGTGRRGEAAGRRELIDRLELANDMFLNAGGPAQHVTATLLPERERYLSTARERLAAARTTLLSAVREIPGLEALPPEGGIHAVLRLPAGLSYTDEEFAVSLVREFGVHLHPGYLYGMDDDRSLVVSLLPGERILQQGLQALRRLLRRL